MLDGRAHDELTEFIFETVIPDTSPCQIQRLINTYKGMNRILNFKIFLNLDIVGK